jgi:hypothetical protein
VVFSKILVEPNFGLALVIYPYHFVSYLKRACSQVQVLEPSQRLNQHAQRLGIGQLSYLVQTLWYALSEHLRNLLVAAHGLML